MTDAITTMMDVLPTLARLAGTTVHHDRKIDGVDVWPVLAGTAGSSDPPRDHFYYFRGLRLEAVRSGPWKLQLASAENPPPPSQAKGKKAGSAARKVQLYHLGDDIGETINVAQQHPHVVQRLEALARRMEGDLGLDGVGPGCRPLGRVENPEPLIK